MASTLSRVRSVLHNVMLIATAFGYLIVWFRPLLAWIIAGLISLGLLFEADHLNRILKSRRERFTVGSILLAIVLLILLASWRLSSMFS